MRVAHSGLGVKAKIILISWHTWILVNSTMRFKDLERRPCFCISSNHDTTSASGQSRQPCHFDGRLSAKHPTRPPACRLQKGRGLVRPAIQSRSNANLVPPADRGLVNAASGWARSVTPPKRQKDRVAELEAQVEALTKLLESQQIQGSTGPSAALESSPETNISSHSAQMPLPQKKRRLEEDSTSGSAPSPDSTITRGFELDAIISRDTQKYLLSKYLYEIMPAFPLVPITGDCDYDTLRETKPIVLQAVLYAACQGILTIEVKEDIAKVIINLFSSAAIAEGKKSLELVLAMQTTVLWYRAPKQYTHVSAFNLIQLAQGIAEEIDIGGRFCSPSIYFPSTAEDISTAAARRAWLVCRVLSASMGIFVRRPVASTWNQHDENYLVMLDYCNDPFPPDRILSQYVRAERLCEQVPAEFNFYDLSVATDVSDPAVQLKMQSLQNSITDWKAQISAPLHRPGFTFWEHAITLYLHESVLHTTTNKQSFAAPFLAERLSVTDFPTPNVMPEHVASLYALKEASQALLDIFASFDLSTLMRLPAILFASRMAYADLILVKLYIATTARGNTFGPFFDPESLKVEQYLDKMIKIATMVHDVDERCGPARVLTSAARMKEWFLNYKTTIAEQHSEQSIDATLNPTLEVSNYPSAAGDAAINWDNYLARERHAVFWAGAGRAFC